MKYTAVLALVLAGLGACAAQSDKPETLADIARRLKTGKKASLVFSDENLPRNRSAAVSTATSDAPAQSSAASASDSAAGKERAATTKTDSNTSATDKKAGDKSSSDLKSELEKARGQQQGWENSAKHYEDLLQNEKDDFRRQMYEDALNNDRSNATMYKRKAEGIESQLNKQKESAGNAAGDATATAKDTPGHP